MSDTFPADLAGILESALWRTRRRLQQSAPTLSVHALDWIASLSRGAPPASYFTHPQAFPVLLLPWWLEGSIRASPSRDLQRDIVYSTVNGYYLVRLIDDLMDGAEQPPSSVVLPAVASFHAEFQHSYSRYFPFGHPFWEAFTASWFGAAEAASRDAGFRTIDRARFVQVSARKIVAAKVPLAAVCHRYRRTDLLEPWDAFVERFGAWHQMLNDIRGWKRDHEAGRATYFLSQAPSDSGSSESIAGWAIDDGLEWGRSELDAWMVDLVEASRALDCPAVVAYLDERRSALELEWRTLAADLVALRRLASALR